MISRGARHRTPCTTSKTWNHPPQIIIIIIIIIIIVIIVVILIIPSAIHAPQLHPLGRLGAESSEVRVGMVTVGPGYRLYGFRV